MELYLLNTSHGLKPLYDSDYEEKKKLRIGEKYRAKITLPRNYEFHKKYFAMISCAWEYLPEDIQQKYGNINEFRRDIQMEAGYKTNSFSLFSDTLYPQPLSISFDKMDEAEFSELYERVKDVIYNAILVKYNVSFEEFEENFMYF